MHSITPAVDGRWIALFHGHEIGCFDTRREAQLACAYDAISAKLDVAYDVAAEHGQIFDNVAHMTWFRDAVADEIEES